MRVRIEKLRRCGRWIAVVVAAVVGTGSGVMGEAPPEEPTVLTARFSTQDAPQVTPTDHGCPGQNVRVTSAFVGGGPVADHAALYLFFTILRDDAAGPPMMAQLDLTDGKLREFYPDDRVNLIQGTEPDPLEGAPSAAPAVMKVTWCWGKPLCGAAAPDGRVYLAMEGRGGAAAGGGTRVVIYNPKANTFQESALCKSPPVGMVFAGSQLLVLTADGMLHKEGLMGGLEPAGRVAIPGGGLHGLMVDDQQVFYTAAGPAPWRLFAFRMQGKSATVTALLPGVTMETFAWQPNVPTPRCSVVVSKDGHFSAQQYELKGGQALPISPTNVWRALVGKQEQDLDTDFSIHPLSVAARPPGGPWKRFPLVFSRAAWDNIKTVLGAPDGKSLYGAGWPTAWIWRFDPPSGTFRIFGSHYVLYEMHNCKDEIWATGYWGVKLMRWRPDEPWTFDYDRHYGRKRYPGNTSPWGDKDVSNPRLVCKFRYLKQLNVRRPAGTVIMDDGTLWVGAHTPAVEGFHSRYAGAVSWYDPASETIGQIPGPFLHHTVRDLCRAGPSHVAVAASAYSPPFEPVPEPFSKGKFVLIDTRDRSVKLDLSPLDSALSYAEEGEPGRVVVAGGPGKYAGDGVLGAFFIFDAKAMKVTQVIRLPVRLVWMEYDNSTRFQRGPDRKIYFYGRDDKGVALCRVDSVTGVVEPVLRGHNITDVASYNNTGAALAFCGDRVYFGAHHLVSLPLETVTGKSLTAGGTP